MNLKPSHFNAKPGCNCPLCMPDEMLMHYMAYYNRLLRGIRHSTKPEHYRQRYILRLLIGLFQSLAIARTKPISYEEIKKLRGISWSD